MARPPRQRRRAPGNFTAFQMTTVLSTLQEASQASWGDHATSITSARQGRALSLPPWHARKHTAPPCPPASRSAAPGFSWLGRLDLRPPSLDLPNHPEALPTQVLQLARFGAPSSPAPPHPSSDEVWKARWGWAPVLCTRVRRPRQSRQDG